MKCLSLLPMLALTVVANAQTFPGPVGIGTDNPSFYFHGGNNKVLEIYNPNTPPNSQSHIILSTGSTAAASSAGSVTWITANSTQSKGLAYIGAWTSADVTTNAVGGLVFATADGIIPNPVVKMKLSPEGWLGIGAAYDPRAYLDVVKPANDVTASVLGRLPEGNDTGPGTYLGVQNYNTQPGAIKSFALEHRFYGELNSAINFHRGGSIKGGFLTFATNDGTEKMRIDENGNVGIGTTGTGTYKLAVAGTIGARRVKVTQETWPDFVFDSAYHLPSLHETAEYINNNKHLPGVPSATEVQKNGLDLGEMNKILLQKIEEMTLHMIEQQKRIEQLERKVAAIQP